MKRCWHRLVDVRKFRIQVSFDAAGPAASPLALNPFQRCWGPGHVYSLASPTQRGQRKLVVCAVVAARSPDEACEAVEKHASELAAGLIVGSLRRRSVLVQPVPPWRRAGRVSAVAGEGDDGLAGDREPRHPVPPPGHVQAERRP